MKEENNIKKRTTKTTMNHEGKGSQQQTKNNEPLPPPLPPLPPQHTHLLPQMTGAMGNNIKVTARMVGDRDGDEDGN